MSEWNCFMMKTEKAEVGSLGPWCWRKVTSWGLTTVKLFASHVGENREGFLKELGTNMAFHKQLTSLKSSQFGWENWNEAKLLSVLHLELSGRRKGSRGNEPIRYFTPSMCLVPDRKSVSLADPGPVPNHSQSCSLPCRSLTPRACVPWRKPCLNFAHPSMVLHRIK